MNEQILKGHWNEAKGKIKQKWGKLTDDDLIRVEGSYDRLLGSLQKKYGYEKDRAEKEIEDLIDENKWND